MSMFNISPNEPDLVEFIIETSKRGDLTPQQSGSLIGRQIAAQKAVELHLEGIEGEGPDFPRIFKGLKNSQVERLYLRGNFLDDRNLSSLTGVLKKTKINLLDLSMNSITQVGAEALKQKLIGNNTIVVLNLHHNSLSDEGIKRLVDLGGRKEDQAQALEKLDVSSNEIGPAGALDLVEGIAENFPKLHILKLQNNHLGDKGAENLTRLPRKNHFTELDLSNNEIGDSGARAVAKIIANASHLEKINLSGNRIGKEGFKALLSAVKKSHIREVNLDLNGLEEKQLQKLAAALTKNKRHSS